MEELLKQAKVYLDIPEKRPGGQIAGMPTYPTVIEHEDLGIKISIEYYRSNHKNRALAITLFELAVSDIMK